jgi:PEP-CTERM motif-containing protein
MQKLWGALLLAGGFAFGEASVEADSPVLVARDSSFGVGTLTLDTLTGLRWLDLPLTVGLNYFQMEAQLGPGGSFAGFRHASRAEVEGLWSSAGIPYTGVGISLAQMQANFGPVGALESLIGLTSPSGMFTTGMVSDVNPSSPGMRLRPIMWSPGPGQAMAAVNEWASGSSSPDIGHWLVAVPEPSAIALVGLGSAGLIVMRRRSAAIPKR